MGDIPLHIEGVLDTRGMAMSAVAALQLGDVVSLHRSAGENIDILVNGVLLGFGEIVIIEDIMAVRITDFANEENR
jgi:flagellar motor switch protein FliN/FliY